MMKTVHKPYNVHKFGGSSLANADRFRVVKSLLNGKNEIIVVSAVKNTTSSLQSMLDEAKDGQDYQTSLKTLEEIHLTLIDALLPKKQAETLKSVIKNDISEIKHILHTVAEIASYPDSIQDFILGYGEQWSAKILTAYLALSDRVAYLDAATILFTNKNHDKITIDYAKSQQALDAFLKEHVFDQLVITGFIAATDEGKRTTLGRNGSDFSGAIFAKLFNADTLTIWTDVDGIYTADPSRVRSAFVIESLSYKEALELAYFGAKVLHPMTIAPALENQIPIIIKNSFNPSAAGTYISAASKHSPYLIKGLTSIDDITLINIEGAGMMGALGMAARVFDAMQKAAISVILISQASSEHSICFAILTRDTALAINILNEHLALEIERHQIEKIVADKECAILAAVGDEMIGRIGASGKLFATLAKANINIRAIAQGSSERNISVVIKLRDVNKALQAVHAGFYLSSKMISIGLIGSGIVGSELLKQIQHASDQLKEKYQVQLCVRGIMNSQKMLLKHEGVDLTNWRDDIHTLGTPASIQQFANHILSDDVPHAVIIDCTASEKIGHAYIDLIEQGIHVITPNKQVNGGDLTYYKKLKSLAREKNRHYLYEATVCAGLPVINTLHDIIKTGDEVLAIEGVVSGTLSYIFNEMAKGRVFSGVVLEAKQRGYTEPDPREDLSGKDVARKLICLAREIGLDVSLEDVAVTNLVPKALMDCSVETFLEKLPDYDDEMNARFKEANAKNQKLYYVAAIRPDKHLYVAIEQVAADHPFTKLSGTDNMLIFHTQRYHEQPLIIQGPGAGAAVTASGIFADLLRLSASLS